MAKEKDSDDKIHLQSGMFGNGFLLSLLIVLLLTSLACGGIVVAVIARTMSAAIAVSPMPQLDSVSQITGDGAKLLATSAVKSALKSQKIEKLEMAVGRATPRSVVAYGTVTSRSSLGTVKTQEFRVFLFQEDADSPTMEVERVGVDGRMVYLNGELTERLSAEARARR